MTTQDGLSVLQATVGRYDEALEAAEQSRQETEADGLLYSRFEGLRCLAAVRLIRAREKSRDLGADQDHAALIRTELNEAERICEAAAALIEPTESRVSRLWLGPTYLEVLMDQKKLAESENDQETAVQKLALARKLLADYEELVNSCQSPRFTAEANRLGEVISGQSKLTSTTQA